MYQVGRIQSKSVIFDEDLRRSTLDHMAKLYPTYKDWNPYDDAYIKERLIEIVEHEIVRKSNPGIPLCEYASSNQGLLDNHANLLVSAALDLFQKWRDKDCTHMGAVEMAQSSCSYAIRVFVKNEPHPLRKIKTGRYRLICSVSVIQNIVERLLFGSYAKACVEEYTNIPSKPGMGFSKQHNEAMHDIMRRALHKFKTLRQNDVQGWDWSFLQQLYEVGRDHFVGATSSSHHAAAFNRLFSNYFHSMMNKIFSLSDGTLLYVETKGVMVSGSYLTGWLNSFARCFMSFYTGLEAGGEPDDLFAIAMGDDCVEDPLPRNYEKWGFVITDELEVSNFPISFCSHSYTGEFAHLESWPKALYNLLAKAPRFVDIEQFFFELGDDHPMVASIKKLLSRIDYKEQGPQSSVLTEDNLVKVEVIKHMPKRNNSDAKTAKTLKKVEHKVEREAKDIKRFVHEGKMHDHSTPGFENANMATAKMRQAGLGEIVQLLGYQEESEAAWLHALVDCERFAARIPSSQTVGAVPVDLYRDTVHGEAKTNEDEVAWVLAAPDAWGGDGTDVYCFLGITEEEATCATTTGSSYVGKLSPASDVVLPAGADPLVVSNVSPNFVSGANGTEYIMVANKLALNADLPPSAAADNVFVGTVRAFRTNDVERAPLAGVTSDDLRDTADEEGSVISTALYHIRQDGCFVAPCGCILTELALSSLPLSNSAYEWRRIGSYGRTSILKTIPDPDIAFCIEAPTGTKFNTRYTGLWQTERYASHKVVKELTPPSDGGFLNGGGASSAGQAAVSAALLPFGLVGSGVSALGHWGGIWASMPHPSKAPKVKPPSVKTGPSRPKKPQQRPPVRTGPPASLKHFMRHTNNTLGTVPHPVVAPLSVIAGAGERPGFWNQLQAAGPKAVSNILRDPRAINALKKHGPAVMSQLEAQSDGPGFWTKAAKAGSTIVDILKIVGPVVAALIA